jgi:hypothetical protein
LSFLLRCVRCALRVKPRAVIAVGLAGALWTTVATPGCGSMSSRRGSRPTPSRSGAPAIRPRDPTKDIPLTSAPVTQSLLSTDLIGGSPQPSPDPQNLLSFIWTLSWSGPGAAQYAVDITVDNIQFLP